jgi:hypothetical protein
VGLGAFAVQRLRSVESVSAEIRDNWMPGMAAASRLRRRPEISAPQPGLGARWNSSNLDGICRPLG